MVRINIPEMQGWIARSEAIAARIEEAYGLSQDLYTLANNAYEGQAKQENELYTASLSNHMVSLWKFHMIRTQHMKNTLETLLRCDEGISGKIDGISCVSPALSNNLNCHSGGRP